MKAIILTYAPVTASEREILKCTGIFKLALNHHAADMNPNARIITDYILQKICKNFPEKIISLRDRLRYYSPKIEYPNIEFKGSTIIAAIDYIISKNYDEILIVGDNTVNTIKFRDTVNKEIDKLSSKIQIFQYSNGNFNLQIKTIKDFIN